MTPVEDLGVKEGYSMFNGQGMYELRRTVAPAALVEVSFHDNPEDARFIVDNMEAVSYTHLDVYKRQVLYSEEAMPSVHEDKFKDLRIKIDEDGRITDMDFNSFMPTSSLVGMDCYLIRKDLLEYLVEDAISRGKYNFCLLYTSRCV